MEPDKLMRNCIPRLYHQKEFIPFLQAIDRTIRSLEGDIDKIPLLVDVDSCPDFILPYLAALTKCPLWGQSPLLWRKQIKNWPHVCRMKGTKKALRYFFDSLGLITEKIETYWRDVEGQYQTQKPFGAPYLNTKTGLWHNSRTHFFSVELKFDNKIKCTDKDLENLSINILNWIDKVKPAHSELLKKIIYNKYFEEKIVKNHFGIGIIQSGTQKIKTSLPTQIMINHKTGGAVCLSGQRTITTNIDTKFKLGIYTASIFLIAGRLKIPIREGEM